MQIGDLVYNVSIDGTQWADIGSSIQSLTIFQRHDYAVPVCKIVLEDAANYLGNTVFAEEGSILVLEWGVQPSIEQQTFRVASVSQNVHNNVVFYTLFGYADMPEWFLGGTSKHYDMPTSGVIEALAGEAGLQSDIDATQDRPPSQHACWRGLSERRCVFARRLARKGIVDGQSLMGLHTSFDTVRYKNLNAIDTQNPVGIFAYGQFQGNSGGVTTYPISSYRPVLRGGIQALEMGYRQQVMDQTLGTLPDQGKEFKTQDRVQVRRRASTLQHNDDLDGRVGSLPTQIGILTSDNVHPKYNIAEYQNSRGMKLLMSCRIEVLTFVPTTIEIFDPIEIQLGGVERGAGSDKSAPTYDGGYLVYGRVIQIAGSRYGEKLLGCRESNN